MIDFQNNGNPGIYATLADAFYLPWRLISDNDKFEEFKAQIAKRGFEDAELTSRMTHLAAQNLELQLLADGNEALLREILHDDLGRDAAKSCTPADLEKLLSANKIDVASALSKRVIRDPSLAVRMPKQFLDAINDLKSGAL